MILDSTEKNISLSKENCELSNDMYYHYNKSIRLPSKKTLSEFKMIKGLWRIESD